MSKLNLSVIINFVFVSEIIDTLNFIEILFISTLFECTSALLRNEVYKFSIPFQNILLLYQIVFYL